MTDHGQYDIPEWALCYMENGERDNLEDDDVAMVDAWLDENFPHGYYMEVDWDDYNELDFFPAFGHRNKNALTRCGESPYLGVKTYKVNFYTDE